MADQGGEKLAALLVEAQSVGLVGPGPVLAHLDHARGFANLFHQPPEGLCLDLGSGAGLPGLVLALEWPTSRWLLLDGRTRSAEFLGDAVRRLGLERRVKVVGGRAEVIARDPMYRGTVQVVVARSVASPAAVAECAAGFLMPGGQLLVSEPPESSGDRWDPIGLSRLGMGSAHVVATSQQFHFALIDQHLPCPPGYPRRTSVPARRPLF